LLFVAKIRHRRHQITY